MAQSRELLRQGKVRWTRHVETRMAERGFQKDEVRDCILSGRFVEPPFVPNKSGEFQYEFKVGALIEGRDIEVVVSLVPERRVIVITVIDPN